MRSSGERWVLRFQGGLMTRPGALRFGTQAAATQAAFWLRRCGCETWPVRKGR
jgi:hypothetical protein